MRKRFSLKYLTLPTSALLDKKFVYNLVGRLPLKGCEEK